MIAKPVESLIVSTAKINGIRACLVSNSKIVNQLIKTIRNSWNWHKIKNLNNARSVISMLKGMKVAIT